MGTIITIKFSHLERCVLPHLRKYKQAAVCQARHGRLKVVISKPDHHLPTAITQDQEHVCLPNTRPFSTMSSLSAKPLPEQVKTHKITFA